MPKHRRLYRFARDHSLSFLVAYRVLPILAGVALFVLLVLAVFEPAPKTQKALPIPQTHCGTLTQLHIDHATFCTHGGDPDPTPGSPEARLTCLPVVGCPTSSPSPRPTPAPMFACASTEEVGANRHGVQLVYGHPADRPDTYSSWASTIRQIAARMDQALPSRNIRWACGPDRQPSIMRIRLPAIGSDDRYTFGDYMSGVRHAHGTSSDRAYLGFVSGVEREYPYGGQATIWDDDQASQDNINNTGPSYSMVDHLTWTGALHELGHNLGAVQCSAPHSSCDGRAGHHHCWDENDIMCYADGGSHPLERRCDVSTPIFDCNHDDYLNVRPPDSSYLAQNWNLARSSFLVAA